MARIAQSWCSTCSELWEEGYTGNVFLPTLVQTPGVNGVDSRNVLREGHLGAGRKSGPEVRSVHQTNAVACEGHFPPGIVIFSCKIKKLTVPRREEV